MKGSIVRAALCATTMLWGVGTAFGQSAPSGAPSAPDAPPQATTPPPAAAISQSSASQAQAVPDAPAAEASDIVVTGSRIVRNGYDSPTPVSVVTQAEIRQAAPVTVADYVNQLPALAGSQTPRTSGSTAGGGLAGANLLNLRNLGSARTLVLLNGRRVTPSTVTGAVDVNTLPQALVQRVDVVTGGASAAWGSDAVSGVVNFILDTNFTGLRGQVQGGVTTAGDGASLSADLSFGHSFADGRGHFVVSAQYSDQRSAYIRNRDWYRNGQYKFFINPAYAPGNGQPQRLILPFSTVNATPEGLITSGPLRGTFFDTAGNVAGTNFQFGQVESGFLQSGGRNNYDMTLDVLQTITPVEQGSIFAHANYDFGGVTAFVEGSYGSSHTSTNTGYYWRVNNEPISINNAYLPQSIRDRLLAAGATGFNLSSINRPIGYPVGQNDRSLVRLLAGLSGSIGGFNWNIYYQYGESRIKNAVDNNLIPSRIVQSIDSIAGPGGTPVCRSGVAGCVPYDPFGERPLTDAQRAWFTGTSLSRIRLTQHVVEANIQGDLFHLPAGAVTLAVGADYRSDSGGVVFSDPIGTAGLWYVANQMPYRGTINVKEGYGEVAVPVLRDSFIGTVGLNGAVRYTDYSTSGGVTTWKIGGNWAPIRDVEFRATRSRDIRAPYLIDLYATGATLAQFLTDPTRNNASVQIVQTTSGNPNLQPEKADSLTAGVVLRPSFFRGFSASIDYYNIRINNAIASNSSQAIVNLCAAGVTSVCPGVIRDAAGNITAVRVQPFNARSEIARGIDFELGYRTNFGTGTLDLRGLVNYADDLRIINPNNTITRVGEVGNNLGVSQGVPRWRGLASATYNSGPFTFQLKERFISASRIEDDFGQFDQNINRVPAIAYTDVFGSYDLRIGGHHVELFAAVENLMDTPPPVDVSQDTQVGQASGTNLFIYDAAGRTVRGGVRFRF